MDYWYFSIFFSCNTTHKTNQGLLYRTGDEHPLFPYVEVSGNNEGDIVCEPVSGNPEKLAILGTKDKIIIIVLLIGVISNSATGCNNCLIILHMFSNK
jgi:hypothetical protein